MSAATLETDGLATQAPDNAEAARVRAWRLERFAVLIAPHAGSGTWYDADYCNDLAAQLADARGDDGFPVCLHAFERLTVAGCDPDIASALLIAL